MKSSFIVMFDTIDDRERFYSTGVLDKHGISEDNMEMSTASLVHCPTEAKESIVNAAKEYTSDIYSTCGGKSFSDCLDFESKCGAMCEFCQHIG
jgi:hypothetical protein